MRSEFSNSNRRSRFPNFIRDKGGYSNLDEFFNFILSYNGSPDVESTLLWIDEIDKLFDMEYILIEEHVKFVTCSLKGSGMVESISKHLYVPRQTTYKTWRRMRRLLQARNLALEEEEMENRSRPFMRSHQSNKTTEQHQQPLVEEQSIKRDSLNLQATISQAQSLDEVIKLIPSIPNSKKSSQNSCQYAIKMSSLWNQRK